MPEIIKKTKGKKNFLLLESRMKDMKFDDLSIEDMITMSDELSFKLRLVGEEILSREKCRELALRHVLKITSKEPRQKAAKRLLEKYPTRDNLGMVIRYCEHYRHRAFEMLKEKDPENAQAIFLNNIYRDE